RSRSRRRATACIPAPSCAAWRSATTGPPRERARWRRRRASPRRRAPRCAWSASSPATCRCRRPSCPSPATCASPMPPRPRPATRPAGVRAEAAFLRGDPVRELAGESEVADLLVVGSRSYGREPAVLLGGVSRRVAHTAACPLLVVARGADAPLAGVYEQA